eukprot:scaffold6.g2797.t1
MATVVVQQIDYLQLHRPWLSLYQQRLRFGQRGATKEVELALIQQMLPEEMLLAVLAKLPPPALAAAQCVCRQWRAAGAAPALWRAACRDAFHDADEEALARLARAQFRGCWKSMLLDRPHLRFDGIFVSRNTYLKQGVVEWKVKNAVHLVLYFRYLRFLPDGTFLYRTTPHPPSAVAKSLLAPPRAPGRRAAAAALGGGEHIIHGRFRLQGDRVLTAMRYQGSFTAEVRSRLRLRSTVRGAHNRLDIQSIVSYDLADSTAVNMLEPGAEEDGGVEGEQRQHHRGMVPYCFVPFTQIDSTPLNLPVSQMDVWLPG